MKEKAWTCCPTSETDGKRSDRQGRWSVQAKASGGTLLCVQSLHTRYKILTTGIALEYALHSTEAATDTLSVASEDRVVLITGFKQHKEEWAPIIRLLLDKNKNGVQKKPLKILTLDNRGMHGSDIPWDRYTTSGMAQDVLALMNHVGWESAHIVGVRYASTACGHSDFLMSC